MAAWAVVAPGLDLPVLRPLLALFLLLGAPTLLLHRKVGFPSDSGTARLLYSFGSSLLGLIMGGLAGQPAAACGRSSDRPLQPAVLATTWLLLNVGLLVWRADVPVLPASSGPPWDAEHWMPASSGRRRLPSLPWSWQCSAQFA